MSGWILSRFYLSGDLGPREISELTLKELCILGKDRKPGAKVVEAHVGGVDAINTDGPRTRFDNAEQELMNGKS